MAAKAQPLISQIAILIQRAYAKGLRDPDLWYGLTRYIYIYI